MYKQPRALYVHLSINLRRKKQLVKPFIQALNNVLFYVDVNVSARWRKDAYFNVTNYYRIYLETKQRDLLHSHTFFVLLLKPIHKDSAPSAVLDSNCCEILTWMSNPLPLAHKKQTHMRHKQGT